MFGLVNKRFQPVLKLKWLKTMGNDRCRFSKVAHRVSVYLSHGWKTTTTASKPVVAECIRPLVLEVCF